MSKRPFCKSSPLSGDVRLAFEYHVVKTESCWIWNGAIFTRRGGYGSFTMRRHGFIGARAHRVAWLIYRGGVESHQHVLHRCDNPACVNPDHLFIGDQSINMKDMASKGRSCVGGKHGMAKLSLDQALRIRADQRKYAEIASEFGVSVPTVCGIKRGHSWKHA